MIVVTVELWPGGDRTRSRVLGRMGIANDAVGTADLGGYDAAIEKSSAMGAVTPGVWKAGRVDRFPRRSRSVGIWDLLRSALNSCLAGRPTYNERSCPDTNAARRVLEAMRVDKPPEGGS